MYLENKFSKEQIIASKQFTINQKDILNALLEEREYSIDEVREIINNFNNKEAK
jgi:hypothetical protein